MLAEHYYFQNKITTFIPKKSKWIKQSIIYNNFN